MSKSSLISSDASCTEKCKLRLHGNIITTAITKLSLTDYQIACFLSNTCKNYAQVLDDEGKSALHVAASCGRRDLCYWLLKTGKLDINLKDSESGYTSLHRSIFYGHINNAVFLIESGAQTQVMDKDDLQAADHAMKDRLVKDFSAHNPCQVYVWGTNNNYTLGIGNQHSRAQPELLDFFRKNNISINQVATDKFHSVFVSSAGRVWSCGHGQGGRLGVGSEQTILTPHPLKTGAELVLAASVGLDHTVLLMESGAVWSCGSNLHHVLGHSPPPACLLTPRTLHPRLPAAMVGVAAARFHTVLWCDTALYTCGLNGGQLGQQKPSRNDKTVIVPKLVTGLSLGEKVKIVDVGTSVGAVAVSTTKGDVYLLHNYQVRRIASKVLDAAKVAVFGGELSVDGDPKLVARGGHEVKVMVLTTTGKLLLWQESFPQLTRCIYPLKRSLTFCGMSVCLSSVLLITKDGEAYVGRVKPKQKKKTVVTPSKAEGMSFNQFIEKVDCHHLSISRVPHIHRAVHITSDPKGQNFVVIQENPKVNLTDIPMVDQSEYPQQLAALLDDAQEDDSLHDLLFQMDHSTLPAHHFVLAHVSEELASLPRTGSIITLQLPGVDTAVLLQMDHSALPAHHLVLAHVSEELASLPRTGSIITLQLPGVDTAVLRQVLKYAYSHDCDILHPGPVQTLNFKGDVIKAAIDVARKLKMPKLIKLLQSLRFEEGVIYYKEGESAQSNPEPVGFERSMFPLLYDVTIASNDGAIFKAHKCVLASRLEYFNNMFTGGWVEAGAMSNLSLPIPQNILREVLDFLYKDEAPTLMESQDTDYISSVMVVADQLFIVRLKEICEVALSCNLSLRNAAYLLQFAVTYNAEQLKSCAKQFICLNLSAILETKSLEVLDNAILEELSQYYRHMIPGMTKRVITPFTTTVSEEEIIDIAETYPVSWVDSRDLAIVDGDLTTKLNKSNLNSSMGKKKISRPRRSSESQRKRVESASSNSDLDCGMEVTSSEKMDFDDLVELTNSDKSEEWKTIDKAQKAVQNRLKVIMMGATMQPSPEEFTMLSAGQWASPPTVIANSPPLRDTRHFPDLTKSTPPCMSSSPKSSYIEIKRMPSAKLSQKQRKRLSSEGLSSGGGGGETKELSIIPVKASPWASIPPLDTSLADVMKTTLNFGSPPSEKSQGMVKFADIMADEIQQRDNWSKMKSKSLHLTQIEDKAMDELRVFYNASNVFDERITVERVISVNIAKPMWIKNRIQ